MSQLEEKGRMIFEYEQEFAETLAARVLYKPKVQVWMVLIPILFVLYMNDLKKYKDGRKGFVKNYLISRKRALEEAIAAIDADRECDVAPLTKKADLPDNARQPYAELLTIMTEHYEALLRTNGKDYNAMVREVYHNQTNYLLFFNQLNKAEKSLNTALRPHLQDNEGVNDVISSMQQHSEQIRRDNALQTFS